MTPATSGPALPEPSATYDRATSCWRMSGGMFPSDSMPSLATLPPWGMTLAGALYELPTPALPISVSGSSSLLKTPTAQLAINGGSQHPDKRKEGGHGPTLADEVEHLLPTPGVAGGGKQVPADAIWRGKAAYKQNGQKVQVHIDRIMDLLPTPRATDGTNGGPNQRGSSGDFMLPSAVVHLLPTPTAMDSAGSRGYQADGEPYTETAGVTLTDAALSSSGAHMPPRLRGGKPPQAESLLDLLSEDEPESA